MKNKATHFLKRYPLKMRFLKILILGYLALGIALFTLNPILLNQLQYSPEWVWKFSVADFAQNILLFLPFGIALRHCYRRSHSQVLWYGLLLSVCIESSQLFIEWRSSNFLDIISNGMGALLGSYFHQYAFSRSTFSQNKTIEKARDVEIPLEIPLACMFVPLGWVSTIRSLWEVSAVVTVFLSAIASLSLIQFTITQQKSSSWPQKIITALLWLSLFILPVLNTRLNVGIALVAIAPILIFLTARLNKGGLSKEKLNKTTLKKTVITTTAAGLLLILCINSHWYFTHGITTWSNNEHLRLSELILSSITMLVSVIWSRQLAQR